MKVSIIVPIYNVEKYLRTCLDSLVNQTLQDIEIILINDASPDNSYLIMQEYEAAYPQLVKCIYLKENLCQGGARNRGLDIAQGEYVLFVDSDDWVDLSICEKLYAKAKEGDYDIVGCDYYKVKEKTGVKTWFSLYYKPQTGKLDTRKRASLVMLYPIPWAKLIRRNLIMNNRLFFPEHVKYEDSAVVPLYFLYANSLGYVEEPLYNYNLREASTSHLANGQHHKDLLTCVDILKEEFFKRGFSEYKEEIEGLNIKQTLHYIYKVISLYEELDDSMLYSLKSLVQRIYPACLSNYYYRMITYVAARKLVELFIHNIDRVRQEHKEGIITNENISYRDYYTAFYDKIASLLEYCKRNNYRVALWGAGLKGTGFLSVIDQKATKIVAVIDKDISKQGNMTDTGHRIISAEEAAGCVDFIIIANKHFYSNNKTDIKQINSDLLTFNLDLYLLMKNSTIEQFID